MSTRGEEIQTAALAILRRYRKPLSAYDLLRALRPHSPKIAPPTVYRALAVLTARGQVHRLESLNAFIACRCDRQHNAAIMSICEDCGSVEESIAPALCEELSSLAGQSGFAAMRHVIEIHGVCATCGTDGPHA